MLQRTVEHPLKTLGLALVSLTLSGCPVWGTTDSETFINCFDDFDCPGGTLCDSVAGECVQSEACVSHGDCPAGSYCDSPSGLCLIPRIDTCGVDADCQTGFECDYRNTCRPQTEVCSHDAECGPEELCIEDGCRPVEDTCTFDAECSVGHTCVNNACAVSCTTDATCPDGSRCEQGACAPATGECLDSSECPDLSTNCVEGRCLRRCEESCNELTQECAEDGFCRTRWAPDGSQVEPFCTDDLQCAEGPHVCVGGLCRTQCDTTAEEPDLICMSFDAQIPICGGEGLCQSESQADSDCRTQSDCPSGLNCTDGLCQ